MSLRIAKLRINAVHGAMGMPHEMREKQPKPRWHATRLRGQRREGGTRMAERFSRLRVGAQCESGFTIQELMVVLIVSSLLVTFSFSLFLFTGKLFASWQKKIELHSEVSRVLQLIASDVHRAKQVLELSDSTMTLVGTSSIEVIYSTQGNRLRRNHHTVGSESVRFVLHLTPMKPFDKHPEGVGISLAGYLSSNSFSAHTNASILQNAKEEFLGTSQ